MVIMFLLILALWFYYEKEFILFLYIPEKNLYYFKKTTLYKALEHNNHKLNFIAIKNYYKEKIRRF